MIKNAIISILFLGIISGQSLNFYEDPTALDMVNTEHKVYIGYNLVNYLDEIQYYLENPQDFCQYFTIVIDRNNIEYDVQVDGNWHFLSRYRVDMDNDGTWEQGWTDASYRSITYSYPEPLDGISQTHQIKFQLDYVNPSVQTITITKYVTITVYGTPRIYKNDHNDFFIQLRNEDSSTKKPVLIVEGFDALNQNYPNIYYNISYDLVNTYLYPGGYEVFILNFANGGDDMRDNADVLLSALEKVQELGPTHLVNLVGLSMGGVIARYALSKAESEGNDHHVGVFVSYDSPQQGTNISYPLQTIISQVDPSFSPQVAALHTALSSMAAKQLLLQNIFDVMEANGHGHEFNSFFNELNGLNGDGFPHRSYNVAISNGTLQASYDVSLLTEPLFTVDASALGIGGNIITIYPTGIDIGAGSLTEMQFSFSIEFSADIVPITIPWGIGEVAIHFDPVFIPTWSALDLQDVVFDGNYNITDYSGTTFDETILQTTTQYHSALTQTTMDALWNIFETGNVDVKLSNEYNGSNLTGTTLSVIGVLIGIPSGTIVTLQNQSNYVIQTDHHKLENMVIMHHHWNNDNDKYLLRKDLYVEHGIPPQIAQFEEYKIININSSVQTNLQLHDPWYLENPDDPPSEWIQPDDFLPISPGSYQVFLNQDPNQTPVYYTLRAPNIGAVTQSDIWVFDYWKGMGVDFGGGADSTTSLETDVVFLQAGATVTAHYVSANQEGKRVTVDQGDTLTLPAGGTYEIMNVNFGLLINKHLISPKSNHPICIIGYSRKIRGINIKKCLSTFQYI